MRTSCAIKFPVFSVACLVAAGHCSSPALPPPATGTGAPPPPPIVFALKPPPEQPQGPGRTLLFISDLHFGLGPGAPDWDAYEDFRWAPEWSQFLSQIDGEGGGRTDLVINGDAFELWQSRSHDCASRDPERGCSAAEAQARVERVLAAHGPELRRLGAFAMSGDNRVVLVPGNHDAALLFPGVAAAVMRASGAPADRLTVAASGYYVSRDRRVYADHGHQLGSDPNAYRDWPLPFRRHGDTYHLARPWGEQFMQSFYNAYEDRYPIIDNIASESDAVRFAILREGQAGVLQATGRFVGFNLLRTSWMQRADLAGLTHRPPGGDAASGGDKGRDATFRPYLDGALAGLRAQRLADDAARFDLYVYSHTHNLDAGFDLPGAGGTIRVVNSGAWQRVVSADWLKGEAARRGLGPRDVLVAVRLEELPACYGLVRVRPYPAGERPQAEVLYYRSGPGAPRFSPTCD